MKNFISILIISLFISLNANADTDGEITISQNESNEEVKDVLNLLIEEYLLLIEQ